MEEYKFYSHMISILWDTVTSGMPNKVGKEGFFSGWF